MSIWEQINAIFQQHQLLCIAVMMFGSLGAQAAYHCFIESINSKNPRLAQRLGG